MARCSGGAGEALSALLVTLGAALHAFHSFACQEAITVLRSLPPRQLRTALVLDLLARCYFELGNHAKAVEVWEECCDRHRCHHGVCLDLYSTALWHLRDVPKLGALAQRCLKWDRHRPQTWCVVGNCFSLGGDHDQAVRSLKRAVELDPAAAYAHTLLAHEYAESDQLDKAIQMYQRAIAIDRRHYNAWWGLGNVYQRQEDHKNARFHFEAAMRINGGNAVLRNSLGLAYQALQQPDRALELYRSAERSPPCRALATFLRGSLLGALGRHDEAVEVLHRASVMAPREASVQLQLGRELVAVGDRRRALLHITRSMDLCGSRSPQDQQLIMAAQAELARSSLLDAAEAAEESPAAAEGASAGGGAARRRR